MAQKKDKKRSSASNQDEVKKNKDKKESAASQKKDDDKGQEKSKPIDLEHESIIFEKPSTVEAQNSSNFSVQNQSSTATTRSSAKNSTLVINPKNTSDVLKEFIPPRKENKIETDSTTNRPPSIISIVSDHDPTPKDSQELETELHDAQEDPEHQDFELKEIEKTRCKQFLGVLYRLRGLILAILASIQLSCAAYLVRRLLKERSYDATHCAISRFVGLVFFSMLIIPFVQKKNPIISVVCPTKTKAQRWVLLKLLLRGFFGCLTIGFQFYSLNFIELGDASVILFSNPAFVAFAAHFVLKEKCGIFPIFTALLTIVGVMLVSKPPFITGKPGEYGYHQAIGIALAVGGMLCNTASIIIIRLMKGVHFSIVTFFFGLVGLIMAIIVAASTGKLTGGPSPILATDYIMLVGVGVISFFGIAATTLALFYEQAGPVAIARSSEVIFSFLWQMISSIYPDAFSLGGAALVFFCIMITGFRQYVGQLKDGHKCKKAFWWILK